MYYTTIIIHLHIHLINFYYGILGCIYFYYNYIKYITYIIVPV